MKAEAQTLPPAPPGGENGRPSSHGASDIAEATAAPRSRLAGVGTVEGAARVILGPDRPVIEALRVLTDTGKEIVLVCDESGRLLGTVTDGDIRRALLAGRSIDQTALCEVMNPGFRSVDAHASRAEVLDMMRARDIAHIPVLDENGRVMGLHRIHEMLGAVERPNWAVVMAGGKGTRLRPLTEHIPKPMVRVAGRPILERLILHLIGYGIRRIYLAINYLGHVVESYFGDGSAYGCSIHYLRETQPRGTAGALALLPEAPSHPLLVMNGDLVTEANIANLLEVHTENGYAATMCVREHAVQVPFGVAEVVAGRVVSLREKPTHSWLINAGIYVLAPELVRKVPHDGEFGMTDLFQLCLDGGLPVGAHTVDDDWIDVGRPDQLLLANGHT